MRCAVSVSRQELIFIATVCFVCLLIMIIPNFILLYSSVNVIKQGKRVEEALFFNIDTMGHNWLYLQNVGNQMLHHGRSRRKDYAILSVTIQKYKNFCNCYGRKAGLQLLSTVDAYGINHRYIEFAVVKTKEWDSWNDRGATSKPIELIFDIDPKLPQTLFGDALRLRQIIINLMNNAIKFTKEGSVKLKIQIKNVVSNDMELFISVSDTGQGIKEKDLGRNF